LEEDLDENTGRGGGFLLVEMNDGEDMPGYAVGRQKVAKEAGDVAEAVRFVAMDSAVVLQQLSVFFD